MGIKAELGEAGFAIWDRWSAPAPKYLARDALASWRSFKSTGAVTIASLFRLARLNGYRCDHDYKTILPSKEDIATREAKRVADCKLLARKREAASKRAALIWNETDGDVEGTQPNVIGHRYLKHKCIQPHGARIFRGQMNIRRMDCHGALMIPMSLNGRITSLQFINDTREKRFLPDGEKGGHLIGKIENGKPVCFCEGFATGASIYEAVDHPVVVAFDAGNLKKIAMAFRAKHPNIQIIVCADNDHATSGNPGLTKATEAALAVHGLLAIPQR